MISQRSYPSLCLHIKRAPCFAIHSIMELINVLRENLICDLLDRRQQSCVGYSENFDPD